jgi:hypothetical protein
MILHVVSDQRHHWETGITSLLCSFRAKSSLRKRNYVTSMNLHLAPEQWHHWETGIKSLLCPFRAMSSLTNRNHVTSMFFQSNVITHKQESCHFYVLSEQCHHSEAGTMPLLCSWTFFRPSFSSVLNISFTTTVILSVLLRFFYVLHKKCLSCKHFRLTSYLSTITRYTYGLFFQSWDNNH